MAGYVYRGTHTGPDSFDMPVRYKSDPPPPKPPKDLMPCGTRAAARRHERRGERLKDCPPCWEASRRYKADLLARRVAS